MIDRTPYWLPRSLRAQERGRLRRHAPTIPATSPSQARGPLRRCADALDDAVARWFPIHVAKASGSCFVDVDGIEYVDFCLGDTGAMTGHARRPSPTRSPSRRDRVDHDAAIGRRRLGRRRTRPPVPAPEVAAGDDRHRCQPVRPALRPSPHRSTEDRGDGLVLSRHRRRDAGDPVRDRAGVAVRERSAPRSTRRYDPVVPFNDVDALDRGLDDGDVAAC